MTKNNNNQQIVIYQTDDGKTLIDVKLRQETVWLSQAQMVELFDRNKRTISEHIGNIFKEGELLENSVVRKSQIARKEGTSHVGRKQTRRT